MSIDVFKPAGSRVWHYRFQVANKRVQRSTRLRDKGKAQQLADREYDAAVARANGGEPIATLDEMFAEWLRVRGPIHSPAHRSSVDVVRRLHLYGMGALPVDQLTTARIEDARNAHLATHKAASVNHWLRVMTLVVKWGVTRGMAPAFPWEVKKLKVQKRPRAILPLSAAMAWFDEIDRATTREPCMAVAIRLMFGIGLRESEATSARWEWLDWERETYTPGITKGKEAEPIPLPEWLRNYLAPLRQAAGLMAPCRDGSSLPPGFHRGVIRRANAACRLQGITPHRLRGSFATLLSEAGVGIQDIQAALRHKSPLTTMAYLERNRSKVKDAQQKIASKIGFSRRESGAELESSLTDD
ncbi:tyrosine-type recombinase/integrase [Duganella sp. FT92W]|uniref:Tyrosine-type recombinase/integrase n=1 Tax=Pseudoduganella rivuli TaxID=2666085 RepID=A0A7X2IN67_9BURK|nr:site-specific integrase [Pseudoduganella rivuli]MRV72548.1 tyrosine-type recombinase/integrase [Pseudoduganella rivuli]